MKMFKCDKCGEIHAGFPIVYDFCVPCSAHCDFARSKLKPKDWISVKDAVPRHDRMVHVMMDSERDVWRCYFRMPQDGGRAWCWGDSGELVTQWNTITYWKPIY